MLGQYLEAKQKHSFGLKINNMKIKVFNDKSVPAFGFSRKISSSWSHWSNLTISKSWSSKVYFSLIHFGSWKPPNYQSIVFELE